MIDNNAPLLEMRDIKKNFLGNRVLTDINFTLEVGQVLGLVGENGVGRSTLMKPLPGMDVIRETGEYGGDVLINGEKVSFPTPFDALEARTGVIHQESFLIPGFTATGNTLLNWKSKKKNMVSKVFGDQLDALDCKKMAKISEKVIDKMGAKIDAEVTINEMSVGYKQSTKIVRELSKEWLKLLILDESTTVLTGQGAEVLLELIRSMATKGVVVIFITHRLHKTLSVCDKVVIMRDGYVVKDVAAKETGVTDITKWMMGGDVQAAARSDIKIDPNAKTVMFTHNLRVDMPNETMRDVNLDMRGGEILEIGGLVGQEKLGIPNGVMGLYEAGGAVELDGQRIALSSLREYLDVSLTFVSEGRRGVGLLSNETLGWSITSTVMQIQNKFPKECLGGVISWRDKKAIHEATQKYIDELQIKCTGSMQKAKGLSGGSQQEVRLAKVSVPEPKLLFVSGPTRGADVDVKSLVLDALKRFSRENGVAVVVISSKLEELRTTRDRIAIVSGGKIAGILSVTESSEEFGLLMVSQTK